MSDVGLGVRIGVHRSGGGSLGVRDGTVSKTEIWEELKCLKFMDNMKIMEKYEI